MPCTSKISITILLISLFAMSYHCNTLYDGGVFLNNILFDMDLQTEISQFPPPGANFAFHINFLDIWLEENWYYFSYYNKSCFIARARPDFTNFQYITTLNYDPSYGICKFGLDKVNNYLYYANGTEVIQSLVNGENPVTYMNDTMYQPLAVQFDVITGAVWYADSMARFSALYPNGTLVGPLTLSETIIDDFVVFDDYLYFITLSNVQIYHVGQSPYTIYGVGKGQLLALDIQTQNIYVACGQYCTESFVTMNHFYYSDTAWVVRLVNATIKSITYFTIYPMTKCGASGCNNANCISTDGGDQYNCSCIPNYYGESCENYCTSQVCTNKGTCNASGGCDCNENYYGNNCTIYCDSEVCNLNGQCSNVGKCVCNEYYTGVNCSDCIIPLPEAPSSFSANVISADNTKGVLSYNYHSQILVLNLTSYVIYKDYISGLEYNYTVSGCKAIELYFASIPPIQPTPSSHLVYWNGTAGSCVQGTASQWVNDPEGSPSVLIFYQDCNSPTEEVLYFVSWRSNSLLFDVSSYNFDPPKSVFSIPPSCFL